MNYESAFLKLKHCLRASIEDERPSEKGWALISVLYIVAVLALLAAATQALLLTSAELDRRSWERTQADAILDGAVTRAVVAITDRRLDWRWPVDATEQSFSYDNIPISVKVQDQLGLIDLNAADGSMIKRLIQAAGQSENSANTLTDRILDWRSGSGLNRLKVATDDDYAAAALSYRPRHGPFQSVEELRLVLGITSELFQKIEPAITVYSGHPAFEPATAPEMALKALYFDRPDEVTKALAARTQNSADSLGSRPGALSSAVSLAGRSFAVSASMKIGNRNYRRKTVVMLTEDPRRPFLTLAWY